MRQGRLHIAILVGCAIGALAGCGEEAPSSVAQTQQAVLSSYLDCFADGQNGVHDLPLLAFTVSSATASINDLCVSVCQSYGYAFAGTQGYPSVLNYTQCYCGNSFGSQGYAGYGKCNLTCGENASERCGGRAYQGGVEANSVYRVGASSLGCYADNYSMTGRHDLPHLLFAEATVEQCVTGCRSGGYAYAGLQNAGNCYCGNAYGSQGSSNACGSPCIANYYEFCGGPGANSVYATGNPACTPTTCAAQNKTCGTISDGCGNTLACGSCDTGTTCLSSNVCIKPADPTLALTRLSSGAIQISAKGGTPFVAYELQVTSDLVEKSWTTLATVTTDAGGNFMYTDLAAAGKAERFYRASFNN